MSKFTLYVTDWAPNGTNDLLVVNKYGEILECIEEATFGIDVCKPNKKTLLVADTTVVYEIEKSSFIPEIHTAVKRIGATELLRKLCVSPVDPNGEELQARLIKAGVLK